MIVLLARDGGGGDVGAVPRGGVDREAAPAGADLDDAVTGAQPQLAADRFELCDRGLFERGRVVREDAAGVGHRRVEHELIERIAEIVVRGDVTGAALSAVTIEPVEGLVQRRAEPGPTAVHAVHDRTVGDEQAHERREIVATPKIFDVGVACAHRAAEGDVGEELRVAYLDGHREVEAGGSIAEIVALTLWLDQRQRPVLQPRQLAEQQTATETGK